MSETYCGQDKRLNVFFCFNGKTKVLNVYKEKLCFSFFFLSTEQLYGIPVFQQSLRVNNTVVLSLDLVLNDKEEDGDKTQTTFLNKVLCGNKVSNDITFITVEVLGRLQGGKGGFGSLLRGQRGVRRKTRNFDSCRDLNGRRIRHIKALERLTQWLEKKQRDSALIKALQGDGATGSFPTVKKDKNQQISGISSPTLQDVGERYLQEIDHVFTLTKNAVDVALLHKKPIEQETKPTHTNSASQCRTLDSQSSSPSLKSNLHVPLQNSEVLGRRSRDLNTRFLDTSLVEDKDSDDESSSSGTNITSTSLLRCGPQFQFNSLLSSVSSSSK